MRALPVWNEPMSIRALIAGPVDEAHAGRAAGGIGDRLGDLGDGVRLRMADVEHMPGRTRVARRRRAR